MIAKAFIIICSRISHPPHVAGLRLRNAIPCVIIGLNRINRLLLTRPVCLIALDIVSRISLHQQLRIDRQIRHANDKHQELQDSKQAFLLLRRCKSGREQSGLHQQHCRCEVNIFQRLIGIAAVQKHNSSRQYKCSQKNDLQLLLFPYFPASLTGQHKNRENRHI